MRENAFPIWYPGQDDERIAQHLGYQTMSELGLLPPNDPWTNAIYGGVIHPRKKKPFTVKGKGTVKVYKFAKKLNDFLQVTSRFTIGPEGRLARFSMRTT